MPLSGDVYRRGSEREGLALPVLKASPGQDCGLVELPPTCEALAWPPLLLALTG